MTHSAFISPTISTETFTSDDLLEDNLKIKLRELYPGYNPEHAKAAERLSHELTVIRREKYEEYFLDLADVVWLARSNQTPVWCLWEPLNRSLVAHLLGANPLNPIAWRLPPPRWPEGRAHCPPHLTLMLHLSESAEPAIRRAAAEHFGELRAYELGLLPGTMTDDDMAYINSQPAHFALWAWPDIDRQERYLKLVDQNCSEADRTRGTA